MNRLTKNQRQLINKINPSDTILYELTEYVLDRNRPYVETLMQRDGAGFLSATYTYGNQRINTESINNLSGIYTYDGRGSVSSVIGGWGDFRATYWYDGLGNVKSQIHGYGVFGSGKRHFGYNAEQYNPVTGNQNLRARQVNIRRQRFLTEDTYLGNQIDALSLNRYIYGNDNPLKFKDPSGNASMPYEAQQELYNIYSKYVTNYFTGMENAATYALDNIKNSISYGIDISTMVVSEVVKLSPTKIIIDSAVAGMASLPRTDNNRVENSNNPYKRGEYRDGLPDYTIAINEMLEREERSYRNVAILAEATRIVDWTGLTAETIKYGYFYLQERTNGRLDIKEKYQWYNVFGNTNDNVIIQYLGKSGEESEFIYAGNVINASELGNIAYGYWGKSLGFTDETLFYGGGFVRLRADGLFDDNIFNRLITDKYYGDRPEDIEDIMKGIELYNCMHLIGCGGGK